eukprot:TRINITY_DN12221_c0_g1_i1.p2 TRINITY_DN12221_c0_g1~~TRINITY_DN12221_c0_g1_i1.p2  ORF type:complete len:114 (+),score=6.86 TRINITY_DN12221_c0_g1_i1:39-344(+)
MANQVDLSTNSAELKEAYDLVCSGSDEADWLIADYKGKTNTLKISETGGRICLETANLPRRAIMNWTLNTNCDGDRWWSGGDSGRIQRFANPIRLCTCGGS